MGMENRSAPPCVVTPVVAYEDVDAAVRWLEAAFGFRMRLRIGNHRAQMWFGSACIIVGEAGPDKQWGTKSSTRLRVDDVDAACARAEAHGAKVVHPLETHAYGERQCTLEDFAGQVWTLTQTIADVEPEVWGGEAVEL
jgi:uncharacterized glyoxalase superfamily protein PhnB